MSHRLASAASPYLRAHAENPVDWYPWGEEALSRARREDKPILLSVGYAACHWCHVMAHESFEDPEIAALMNRHFINIKVDREERPDIDQLYQLSAQLQGQGGGWPLTVFLTPDQRPFFSGTYFPPRARHGAHGFDEILTALADAWANRRDEVVAEAGALIGAIVDTQRADLANGAPSGFTRTTFERAVELLRRRFDETHGGFGHRPKFPNPLALELLALAARRAAGPAPEAEHVRRTLVAMADGGLWDQLGGGFHRYSTDERWLVPHFEKMLYDNGLLLRLYADWFAGAASDQARMIVDGIVQWMRNEMMASDGAFFGAQDADSLPTSGTSARPEEGAYFVWTRAELDAALADDPVAAAVAARHFGVESRGNFENSAASVLSRARPLEDVAKALALPIDDAARALARARTQLHAARALRPAPRRDDKVITAWNALAISGLAAAAMATDANEPLAIAERAMGAVLAGAWSGGRLFRTGAVAGFLDDYANLAVAALDLYEATAEPRHVELARALVAAARDRFADPAGGPFFYAPSDGEPLAMRSKDLWDQATPSSNAVLAHALLRLHALDGDDAHAVLAESLLTPLAEAAETSPLGFAHTLWVADRMVRGATDVLVVGATDAADTRALLTVARRTARGHRTIAFVDPARPETLAACPALAAGKPPAARAVAYVCRDHACSAPVAEPRALEALLTSSPG